MISFSKLGEYGRFGNQLFQYAFLRTQAKRLGVKFFCPPWLGEKVFLLNDANEKTSSFSPLQIYQEDPYQHGFSDEALKIEDWTDIAGYFQSWEFFDSDDIFTWYRFDEDMFSDVREKYKTIDFTRSVSVHVRLGDYLQGSLMFYTPTPYYFKRALSLLENTGTVLIFSEDVNLVKKYLGPMSKNTVYIEGNKDYEDFYLMTLCKDNIISPSSFSWWAAYLNKHPDKRVVVPQHWYIPYSHVVNTSMVMRNWIQIEGHRVLLDNYYVRYIVMYIKSLVRTIKR